MRLGSAEMTFRYTDSFRAAYGLEGYERLLLDAMHGDQSLFTRSDAIERLWEISATCWTIRPRSTLTPRVMGTATCTRPHHRPLPLAPARRRLTITKYRLARGHRRARSPAQQAAVRIQPCSRVSGADAVQVAQRRVI